METVPLLTKEEQEEAVIIRDELMAIFGDNPSTRISFKINALEKAFNDGDIKILRLYRRYLVECRPYDINRAADAQLYLGFPVESVDDDCMAIVRRFHDVLMRERTDNVKAVDSQTMTILLRHVVAHPDELEMVLRIILERRARGYIEVLKTLADIKSQEISHPLQHGAL